MENKLFQINGTIETPQDVTLEDVMNEVITFVEEKGWYFGGGIKPYKEEQE
jgi:hypothetical protein